MTQLPLIMLCIEVSWLKYSVVLNGLRYGIACLFISFVSRRSIIYFNEWSQAPTYSHLAVVAGLFDQWPGVIRNYRVISKPKLSLNHIFIYRKVVWHKHAIFISDPDRHEVEGSCLALVFQFSDSIFG